LRLRLEVAKNDRATSCLVIAQENGITALRSISLAKVSLESGGAIVTLGRNSDSTEFIEKHNSKLSSFLSESRDIVETLM
jgi:hypothetical protein